MATGFPHKNWLGFPKGWVKMGRVKGKTSFDKKGEAILTTEIHTFCKNNLSIGRQGKEVFKYCQVCMIAIVEKKETKD